VILPLRMSVLTLLVSLSALAVGQPLVAFNDLPERAEQRPAVQGALRDLSEARSTQARSAADPLALRLERVQARQGVELAEAELTAARFEGLAELASAWARVRETELQLRLSESARELAARALAIAQIRLERGSATTLDVEEARTALEEADTNVSAVRDAAALTRSDLIGLSNFEGPFDFSPIPRSQLETLIASIAELNAALPRTPTMLRVLHGVELTQIALELLDPSFASRAQIEQAERQRAQAEEGAREAQRGLALRNQSLINSVESARERDRLARETLAQLREREAIEERRFSAGLIAEIALLQAGLATLQGELAAMQAEHTLMNALLDLQAATLVPLEGWHER